MPAVTGSNLYANAQRPPPARQGDIVALAIGLARLSSGNGTKVLPALQGSRPCPPDLGCNGFSDARFADATRRRANYKLLFKDIESRKKSIEEYDGCACLPHVVADMHKGCACALQL